MAEPTLNDVMTALKNADAAGDTEAATRLAGIADKLRSAPEPTEKKGTVDLTEYGRKFQEEQSQIRKELTTIDKSKAGQVTGKEYAEKALEGAKYGGAIGAGVGLATGAGALVTGGVGAVTGAIGGLAEAAAKDIGATEYAQNLANMVGSGLVPAQAGIKQLTNTRLVKAVSDGLDEMAKMMIPKYGTLRKVAKFLPEQTPKISGSEAEKALGVEAKTAGVTSVERDKFAQELQSQHGQGATVDSLYESAKSNYDQALAGKTAKDLQEEFKKITKDLPEASRKASVEKIKKIFVDDKGNPLSGNDVINNVKSSNPLFQALSPKEQEAVRKGLNDFIPNKSEEIARKAAEKEFVATAKDTLPELFKAGDARTINQQMLNFTKDVEGTKIFKQEFAHYLSGRPVEEAKTLWSKIAPNIQKILIKDPVEFKKINDVINQAKTQKDMSRATSLILKAGIIGFNQKGEE